MSDDEESAYMTLRCTGAASLGVMTRTAKVVRKAAATYRTAQTYA